MALPSPKELTKLANACRKAGIKTFKCGDVEFTLTDEALEAPRKQTPKTVQNLDEMVGANDPFQTDAPTPEQLLYWSVGINEQAGEEPKGNV